MQFVPEKNLELSSCFANCFLLIVVTHYYLKLSIFKVQWALLNGITDNMESKLSHWTNPKL